MQHVMSVRLRGGDAVSMARWQAVIERYTGRAELRTSDRRSAEAVYKLFAAARDRGAPVTQAKYHVCRHDEGNFAVCATTLVSVA